MAAGIFFILAIIGGFMLGFTIDPSFSEGFYKTSYVRMLFRGGHTHGMLFALFNLGIGLLLDRLKLTDKLKRTLSTAALITLLLPIGLVLRAFTHPSKVFAIFGAIGGVAFIICCILMLMGVMKKEAAPAES
jgi:hypothetical protein